MIDTNGYGVGEQGLGLAEAIGLLRDELLRARAAGGDVGPAFHFGPGPAGPVGHQRRVVEGEAADEGQDVEPLGERRRAGQVLAGLVHRLAPQRPLLSPSRSADNYCRFVIGAYCCSAHTGSSH